MTRLASKNEFILLKTPSLRHSITLLTFIPQLTTYFNKILSFKLNDVGCMPVAAYNLPLSFIYHICLIIASAKPEHDTHVAPSIRRSKS